MAMGQAVTIEDVYRELKLLEERVATREDIEALVDAVEILNNPKTMAAIRRSDEDIKAGRVREVASVDAMLEEL